MRLQIMQIEDVYMNLIIQIIHRKRSFIKLVHHSFQLEMTLYAAKKADDVYLFNNIKKGNWKIVDTCTINASIWFTI